MATAAPDVNEIRRRMAQIRRELHEDVQGVVAGAEAVADWRRWIRNYPWVSLGVAFAVGYLIVPRRHKSAPTIHINAPDAIAPARLAESIPAVASKPKRKSLIWKGAGLLAPIALRFGKNYALQFVEQWMAAQAQKYQGTSPADLAAMFAGMAPGQGQQAEPQPAPPGAGFSRPGPATF